MNNVVIKGNKYGIVLILNDKIPFEELKEEIIQKFKASANFFGSAQMALSIEGRKLSASEENEVLDIISTHTSLSIICIMDNDKDREESFKQLVEAETAKTSSTAADVTQTISADITRQSGQFYKGTLRSGQELESQTSIVILGNVNTGAKVISAGNIIVLGALKGTAYAGVTGNPNAFIVALEMDPIQLRINDVIARSTDGKRKTIEKTAKIAYISEESIYIDTLNKDIIKYIG